MNSTPLDHIAAVGVVPVITVADPNTVVPLVDALVAGGLTTIEITLRTEAGLGAIERVVSEVPRAVVGAGSVTSAVLVDRAVDAGARFLVAPGYDIESVDAARSRGATLIPGVATATELMKAANAGLDTVKVFPVAHLGGVGLVKSFAAVWPHMRFMPTGGVNASTAADYLDVDQVVAVGGSWMLPPDDEDLDRERIAADAARAAMLGQARR